MMSRSLFCSSFVILSLLLPNLVKADEWDLSKVNSPTTNRLQKWCKSEGNQVRYSNIDVPGYAPCGELKTMVVCDASGKKLITSGSLPYGFKECSETPRIVIKRIGPPLPEKEPEEEAISLAKNTSTDPRDQIANGLKTYQDYISSLDEITDEQPSAKKKKPKVDTSGLSSLAGSISPEMLSEAMKLLSQMSQ